MGYTIVTQYTLEQFKTILDHLPDGIISCDVTVFLFDDASIQYQVAEYIKGAQVKCLNGIEAKLENPTKDIILKIYDKQLNKDKMENDLNICINNVSWRLKNYNDIYLDTTSLTINNVDDLELSYVQYLFNNIPNVTVRRWN